MPALYTNRSDADTVETLLLTLGRSATRFRLACPYFGHSEIIENFSAVDKSKIQLIVGLNSATDCRALSSVLDKQNVEVHYFTRDFHSKIYILDDNFVLGSANLTYAGLRKNAESAVHLSKNDSFDLYKRVDDSFDYLWNYSEKLTTVEEFPVKYGEVPVEENFQGVIEDVFGCVSAKKLTRGNVDKSNVFHESGKIEQSNFKQTIKKRLSERGLPLQIQNNELRGGTRKYLLYRIERKEGLMLYMGVNWDTRGKEKYFWPYLMIKKHKAHVLSQVRENIPKNYVLANLQLSDKSPKKENLQDAYLRAIVPIYDIERPPIDTVADAMLELYRLSVDH